MTEYRKHPKKLFFQNMLKSLIVLFLGSIVFVTIITIFPLIGSLTMDDFPIQQVIKDNAKLLVPLLSVSVLVSPLLGFITYKLSRKRFLFLILIGVCAYWLVIIFVMLIWSGFNLTGKDLTPFMKVSLWSFLGYGFISLPIMLPAILIIEKWTRHKKELIE